MNDKELEKEIEERRAKEESSSFYVGTLPDPTVRKAYDPYNGKDPATLLAQLIGEDSQEEEKPRMGINWAPFAAAGAFALISVAAWFSRSLPGYIPPAPTPVPAATSAPTPAPTPQTVLLPVSAENMHNVPDETEYEHTALFVDGRKMGVLVSREAAQSVVRDACAYFEEMVRENYELSGTLDSTVDNQIEYRSAPEANEAEMVTAEELFATLTGSNTRLDVITTESSRKEEVESFKTEEKKDKYLIKGTQIVEAPGRDGRVVTISSVTYKNGKRRSEHTDEETTSVEMQPRVMRIGSQKVTEDEEPGKREGADGPDAGELKFLPPVENGNIVSNYGQRNGVLHLGADYESEEAIPRVLASCAGTVICKMERGGYGLMVELDHGNGFVTRYAHLEQAIVEIGDMVQAGDAIGTIGKSGKPEREAPSLHFELRVNGEAYNPRQYIDK